MSIKSIFCSHSWTVISEVLHRSSMQVLLDGGVRNVKGVDIEEMSKRKLVQLVTCEKCGKVVKFVEIL